MEHKVNVYILIKDTFNMAPKDLRNHSFKLLILMRLQIGIKKANVKQKEKNVFRMKCGDNEQCCKSKAQRKITK